MEASDVLDRRQAAPLTHKIFGIKNPTELELMPSRSVSSEIELWDAQLVGGDERRLSPHRQRSHDRGTWVTSESQPRASDENPTTQTSTPLIKMGAQSRSMSADQND